MVIHTYVCVLTDCSKTISTKIQVPPGYEPAFWRENKQQIKSVRIEKQRWYVCKVVHILSDDNQAASNAEVVEEAVRNILHVKPCYRHPLTVCMVISKKQKEANERGCNHCIQICSHAVYLHTVDVQGRNSGMRDERWWFTPDFVFLLVCLPPNDVSSSGAEKSIDGHSKNSV